MISSKNCLVPVRFPYSISKRASDSDKQTGMVDDFEDFLQGKSRCSQNTCETKPSPTLSVFPSELAYVD